MMTTTSTSKDNNLTSRQFCFHSFEVFRGEARVPAFIYRIDVGGDDFTYYVKAGDVAKGAKAERLAGGFDSRKLALDWIANNIK